MPDKDKRDRCRLAPSAPERVQVIRNIFSWYVTQGLGFKGIADRLNQQGVPSPRGGRWSKKHRDGWAMTTIRDMLCLLDGDGTSLTALQACR